MNKEDLPNIIPVFPLSNFIIFPKTTVPLNIFEPRYIQMVDECMKGNRIIGMVQPKKTGMLKKPDLYKVGCAGKIISFNETEDRRFIISLSGLIRFRIKSEIKREKLYRNFEVDYTEFLDDLEEQKKQVAENDKKNLFNKIKTFFKKINYPIDYSELIKLDVDQLVSTVSMISPFSIEEKQKLIETVKIEDKIKTLSEVISFNLADFQENKTVQ